MEVEQRSEGRVGSGRVMQRGDWNKRRVYCMKGRLETVCNRLDLSSDCMYFFQELD